MDLDSLKLECSGFSQNPELQGLQLLPVVTRGDDFTTRNGQAQGSESNCTVPSPVAIGLLWRPGLTKMSVVAEDTTKTWLHGRFSRRCRCEGWRRWNFLPASLVTWLPYRLRCKEHCQGQWALEVFFSSSVCLSLNTILSIHVPDTGLSAVPILIHLTSWYIQKYVLLFSLFFLMRKRRHGAGRCGAWSQPRALWPQSLNL